jgi:predicted Zn-dependent protease
LIDAKGRGRPRPFCNARRLVAALAALALVSCEPSDGPVMSEGDRAAGAEQHKQLLAELGGAYGGDEAQYVAALGERLAAAAGLERQCTFTLVNSDVVNAFAVPGCYIYITRGLMGIVNSEAELGAVLGHELGHIVGRHAQRQQQRSIWRALGVAAVGLVTGSERLTQIAGAAAGLFTLRYSRSQEYEADDLGIGYLRGAGLDPYESADMLDALGRHERHQAGSGEGNNARSIPEWARTHPLSGNRAERARQAAEQLGVADDALPENRSRYLAAVDGMLWGDDPQQGFVIGRAFAHPIMRIGFSAPEGFSLTNSPQAILIEGPDGLRGQFAGGPAQGLSLAGYTEALAQQLFAGTQVEIEASEAVRVNGLDARISEMLVSARGQRLRATTAVYAAGGTIYHFVVLSNPGAAAPASLGALFASFRLLSPAEAAALRPRAIRVVRSDATADVRALAAPMATSDPLADFLLINDRAEGDTIAAGEPYKLVVLTPR